MTPRGMGLDGAWGAGASNALKGSLSRGAAVAVELRLATSPPTRWTREELHDAHEGTGT
jgi:hypothetical protein